MTARFSGSFISLHLVKMRAQIRREVEFAMRRAFGLEIPLTLEDICDPTRLALVVYDMQVGIVKQIDNGRQITEKVVQVACASADVIPSDRPPTPHQCPNVTRGQ